jgi:hypothetical protein
MYDDTTEKKGGAKKFIIFGIIALLVIIIVTVVVILISQPDVTDEPIVETDAEQIEYDSKDKNTGGENAILPENESLLFLKEYSVSDEDIATIDDEIRETMNTYYPNGYNTVIYDLDSIESFDLNSRIEFDFSGDAKTYSFHIKIYLDSNSKLSSVNINVVE